MVRAGDVLEAPGGERVTFHATAAETDGELLRYEAVIVNAGPLGIEHVHPLQSERHDVLDGEFDIHVDRTRRHVRPGDVVDVLPGVRHKLEASTTIRILFEMRPALRWGPLYETLFALARKGELTKSGRLKLPQIIVLAHEYSDEIRATRPPWAVQRVLFSMLAPLAKALGYRTDHS